jgi:ATP-dependent Lon protease
MSNLV